MKNADIRAPEKWRSPLGKMITPLMQFIISRKLQRRNEIKDSYGREWNALIEKSGLKINNIIEFSGKREPEWEIKRVMISIKKRVLVAVKHGLFIIKKICTLFTSCQL